MITKEQAEQIKEMALGFACAKDVYASTPRTAYAGRREAWEQLRRYENTLNDYVDSLVAQ